MQVNQFIQKKKVIYKRIKGKGNLFFKIWIMDQLKQQDAFFSKYLDLWPKDISEFPETFNEEALNALKGHDCLKQIITNNQLNRLDFEMIH